MTIEKTPISVLQEMAQVNRILPPVYGVQSKGKEFCVTVKFGKNEDIFTEAVAKTKQLAKQLCAKNALELLNRENANLVPDLNENLSAKSWASLTASNILSQNYVGMLNELCSKEMIAVLQYNDCGLENGEFVIECKMYDSVTQGRSKTKKDAKQKAAEAMLKVYNDNEKTRCSKQTELREVAYTINANHVGKLNEICSKRQAVPLYTECGTENDEFIIECKIFDNIITRGQAKTKKDAKQKAAEAMLNQIGESENQIPRKSDESFDDIVNLYKSIKLNVPCENYVGKLIEMCIKKMVPLPMYIEWVTENGEFAVDCKVIHKSVSNITQGHSRTKQGAKEKAAKQMIELLSQYVELKSQTMMKSVLIVETGQQNPTKEFSEHNIVFEQIDLMSVEYMNKEQLEMELMNLNVNYSITKIARIKNALMLKATPNTNSKSFTFMVAGIDNEKINLDLLRKAVFGMRILKTDLGSDLQ